MTPLRIGTTPGAAAFTLPLEAQTRGVRDRRHGGVNMEFREYTRDEHIAHTDEKKNDGLVMMTDCEQCWDEIYMALGEEATLKLADAVPELLAKVNESLMRDDVQGFSRVRNLGGYLPKIWHRLFSGDFMAETYVRKTGAKRQHRLTATGVGLEDALDNLAAVVADYLFPTPVSRSGKTNTTRKDKR